MSWTDDVGRQLAADLSGILGAIPSPDAWRAFAAQVANETAGGDPTTRGVRDNNPLNLRPIPGGWPGQVGVDADPGGPFAIFATTDAGIAAAARNYAAPSYAGVQDAFSSGADPATLAAAIEASPWSAGGYGGSLVTALGGYPVPHAAPGALGLPAKIAAVPGELAAGAARATGRAVLGPLVLGAAIVFVFLIAVDA